jgi:undecaprenyl-diphosphatase
MSRGLWLGVLTLCAALCLLTGLVASKAAIPGDFALVFWAIGLRRPDRTIILNGITFASSAMPALVVTLGVSVAELRRQGRIELGAGWATLAYLGEVASNVGLRVAVGRQRPAVDYIPHQWPEIQASFQQFCYPSGHAGAALLAVGAVIVLAWSCSRARGWVLGSGLLLIAAAGFGRVYVGVHWPSDVLAGYLLGGIWLSLGVELRRWRLSPWRKGN